MTFSQMCNTMTMESWCSEMGTEALAHQSLVKSQLVLIDFAFPTLHSFCDLCDRNDFPLIKSVGFWRDVEQRCDFLEILENAMM